MFVSDKSKENAKMTLKQSECNIFSTNCNKKKNSSNKIKCNKTFMCHVRIFLNENYTKNIPPLEKNT